MSFRASASRGSRHGGQSASAKHAYHTRQGEYLVGVEGVRDDLAATGSGNLPMFAQGDAGQFWEATDSYERANASLFVELQLNLPAELNQEQQQAVVRAYCDRMTDAERLPYSWAIHSGDGENPHVHLMLSERKTDDHDRPADQHFRRYNPTHPERGGAPKTRELQSKAWLMQARGAWAEEVNRGLVAAGHEPRFDHRSKETRRDEALERGEWRRAAELDTLTTQHEGPRIAGMRRRVERELCTLEDLPEYAQDVIQGNDLIRADNAEYLAQVAGMSDAELRLMQANDIQRLARERLGSVARAELAEFEEQAQAEQLEALQALADAQAGPALDEAHAEALIENVERHRARIAELQQAGAATPSRAAIEAQRLQRAAQQAQKTAQQLAAQAQAWRQAHPVRAALADRAGIALPVDRAAAEAKAAAKASATRYNTSPALPVAQQWVSDNRALRELQGRLPAVERAAGIEPQADRDARSRAALDEARRTLRRAAGRIENELTRASRAEAAELIEQREAIRAELEELERLAEQPPEPAEAEQRHSEALERLELAEGWRAATDAARAEAERLQAQAEAERAQARAQQHQGDEPTRKPRGPRL